MKNKLLVLNVVGLSPKHIGPHTPHLTELAKQGCQSHIQSMLPAVTCSVQASYFTGAPPSSHGIVGNGWYMRDLCEVKFWHQSNRLIQQEQIWTRLKQLDSQATSANIFCWYNMYCPADTAVTVRPMYPADGRKIPDIYTYPPELRTELNNELGTFPLFNFWGPNANINSSQWITKAAIKTLQDKQPDLEIVYLPHLDYAMQKYGPDHSSIANELAQADKLCGELIACANDHSYSIVVLSEYGIQKVDQVCHINRLFRQQGWLSIREELGLELLDAQASRVFAVADHQVAHVYIQDKDLGPKVTQLLEQQDEIEFVLDQEGINRFGLNHSRSGELIAVSKANAWFSYYYWLENKNAPDFARTVDIHRKPGYDPVELFIDPAISFPVAKIMGKLLRKKLGFRTLLDVIPLDAQLVKGSHGALNQDPNSGAIYICSDPDALSNETLQEGLQATAVQDHLLSLIKKNT